MKTIFFVINGKARVNFILRSDLFKILKNKDFKIVIISPFWQNPDFTLEFGGPNIFFEPLKSLRRSVAFKIVALRARALSWPHPELKKAREISRFMDRRFQKSPAWLLAARSFVRDFILKLLPRPVKKSEKFWMALLKLSISKTYADWLFEKYRPGLVILGNGGGDGYEIPFLVSAYFRGAASVAVDANLDAATYRHFGALFPATLWAIFGEPQKREFIEIHKVPESSLAVTGALRYDNYFRDFKPLPREEFFKRIGADPRKKLITLGAKTPLVFPHNQDIIKIILDAIGTKEFGGAELLVRFDPGHDPKPYGALLDKILWERSENSSEEGHLKNLLCHSDVYLGLGATTLSIEACAMNTPACWIGFDGFTKYPDRRLSCRLQYDLAVFQRIIKSGAIDLIESKEALVGWIARCLKNPDYNLKAREEMLRREYFNAKDGLSGRRVADLAIKLISYDS